MRALVQTDIERFTVGPLSVCKTLMQGSGVQAEDRCVLLQNKLDGGSPLLRTM